jgi:hypothetical protein
MEKQLFNTIHNNYSPSELKVKIEEKKAPTDDSIRLYDEIKEKVFQSITDRVTFECNTFKGQLLIYDNAQMFGYSCRLICELNGIKYNETFNIDKTYLTTDPTLKQQIQKGIFDILFKNIRIDINCKV